MMMKSTLAPERTEGRQPTRRMAHLLRGRVGRSAAVLMALGVVLAVVLLVGPAIAATFPDVYSDTYDNPDYPEAVSVLSDLGVISGMQDGTFRPHDPVTRQQFAKLIVLLLGLPVTGDEICPFTDVARGTSANDPFYPDKYVAVCASYGITNGTSATTFAPYNNITRAQLLSMVVRAARQADVVLSDPTSDYYDGTSKGSHFFSEWTDVNHAHNAQIAEVNGLLWGIWPAADNTWNPYTNATRGEVAQILYRLWQKMGSPSDTSTTGPTTPPTTPPTTTPPAGLLASDDFSSTSSGWANDTGWSGGVYRRYESGAYVVEVAPQRWTTHTFADVNRANVLVEADLTLVAGDADAGCGLIMHYVDGNNYYLFEFDVNGYYALYKCKQGEWTRMKGWTYSAAIKHVGLANHVEFSASGTSISATVNGTLLFTVIDADIPAGSAGFFVEALGSVNAKAIIDNLDVWAQ